MATKYRAKQFGPNTRWMMPRVYLKLSWFAVQLAVRRPGWRDLTLATKLALLWWRVCDLFGQLLTFRVPEVIWTADFDTEAEGLAVIRERRALLDWPAILIEVKE